MEKDGERAGASKPPGPGRGDTGNGDKGSGCTLCGGAWPLLGSPVGLGGAPYRRNKESWDRRGWSRFLKARSAERSSPGAMPVSSSSELVEVPSLQSETEPRAMRRGTALKTPGLRSSSLGERMSDGVDGGKRKWVLIPDGIGGALCGTPEPIRKVDTF